MRSVCRTLLRILDGSPRHHPTQRQRGQSLLELAFITPLLAIMVVGIAEIGWYANHYLILLDTTRNGARYGTGLTGDVSPLEWDEARTLHPVVYGFDNRTGFNQLDDSDLVETEDGRLLTAAQAARFCGLGGEGFYTAVICQMLNTLDPLTIKGREPFDGEDGNVYRVRQDRTGRVTAVDYFPDDIVVSVFALQMINNADPADFVGDPRAYRVTYDLSNWCLDGNNNIINDADCSEEDQLYESGYRLRVVGRYPSVANECNVTFAPANAASSQPPFMPTLQDTGDPVLDADGNPVVVGGRQLYWPQGTLIYREPDSAPFVNRFRDPFDYIPDFTLNTVSIEEETYDIELSSSYDYRFLLASVPDASEPTLDPADAVPELLPEMQRGFVWTGQHIIEEPIEIVSGDVEWLACIGSEWTNEEVERVMNLPNFLAPYDIPLPPDPTTFSPFNEATYGPVLDAWAEEIAERELEDFVTFPPNRADYADDSDWQDALQVWRDGDPINDIEGLADLNDQWSERRRQLPTSGVILVEMHWGHNLLLNFPFLEPIITMFGDSQRISISVWAAFPGPVVEPNFTYGIP